MSTLQGRILIVDDEPKMTQAVATALRRSGCECATAEDGEQALELFEQHGADVVITDRRMPRMDGIELMGRLLRLRADLPVIVVTAYGDVRSAVDAMRQGAFHYLTKPFDLDELRSLVARALELQQLQNENRRLRRELADRQTGNLVAQSEAMTKVLDLVDRAASSQATLLIQGESGTGKEMIARRAHFSSPRARQPFIAVNCKAFAGGVLESELFGHEKGAFTGAEQRRAGCFERAHGGTLFLDEIGEIDMGFQAKLLRVLQEGEVQRVGGDTPIPVDVRIVAATNRDLRLGIRDATFREDLFYRLHVIPVTLPPLRERREDIVPLAKSFLQRAGRLSGHQLKLGPEAEQALLTHPWPGNVRELENAIERGVVLARGEVLGPEELLLDEPQLGRDATEPGPLQETLDHAATERITAALVQHGGRRAEAAVELGIDRTTLFRWMKRLSISD